MIELKNVTTVVDEAHEEGLTDYSLIVKNGDLCILDNLEGSLVIKTLLGFLPVESGVVSFDGMPLTASSVPFLRKMIAYIPSPEGFENVSDLESKQRKMIDDAMALETDIILACNPFSHQSEENARVIMSQLEAKAARKKVVIVSK